MQRFPKSVTNQARNPAVERHVSRLWDALTDEIKQDTQGRLSFNSFNALDEALDRASAKIEAEDAKEAV